jgi:hypothetical protein
MWTWAIPSVPISFLVCFSDWVPCKLCMGWPQTVIILHLPSE